MTDNINGPVLSASLDELKYLIFEGMQGEQGVPGPQGAPGADGADGADGTDGMSPAVTVTPVAGGHRVTITDADGDHEFNVMDGTDGEDGDDGAGIALLYYLPSYGTMQWYAHPGEESLTDITGAEISDLVLESGRAVFAYEPGTQRLYQLARLPDNMGNAGWFICWTQYEVDLLEMAWDSAAVTKSNVTPTRIPNYSGAAGGSVLKVIDAGSSRFIAWGSVPGALPAGGTEGQALLSDGEGGAEWRDIANFPSGKASGAAAVFPDGADGIPVKSLVVEILPVQSGSGDPSPANVRPISGWTGVNVTRTDADNQGSTYTITFPAEAGTVYGGTLDATNGVLTVNWAMVDMGSLRWIYNDTYKFFSAPSLNKKPGALNVMSDLFRTKTGSWNGTPVENALWGNGTNDTVYVQHAPYVSMSANEFKNLVTGHQLLYELANPVAYQLDPVTVTTLLGTNNIWADTGDVAVEYRADTGLYIRKLTGSAGDEMVANEPIASGRYFFVGSTLYLSTAAIAAGAVLTPGTNCVKTDLAAALNALNS